MAQRRMMSMHIIDSDAFLDMPVSSQNLYMHMLMRADDDGFVSNPKKISRMIGCSDDDMRVLVSKRFVIPFESGVCVIKHWKIHNYIQKDRYQETKYIEEMAHLEVKENGAYSLDTECIHDGYTGKVSIGKSKVRLGEITEVVSSTKEKFGQFSNVLLEPIEYLKLTEQYGESATQSLIDELGSYMASTGKRYKSHYATLLNWARRKIQEHATKNRNFNTPKLTADFSK